LGLIVTKTAAGSVVAQHYSHESHASHEYKQLLDGRRVDARF
jgi:hypothetical protein